MMLTYYIYTSCSSEIWKLPCFDVEVPDACLNKWKEHYEQYRQEMTNALKNGHEGKNDAAEEVIKKYKKVFLRRYCMALRNLRRVKGGWKKYLVRLLQYITSLTILLIAEDLPVIVALLGGLQDQPYSSTMP